MAAPAPSLSVLNDRIVACTRCPRLRAYSSEIARIRRRAYANCEYWGKPVPSFGDPGARVLVLGLAPGAHGSNRTGRMFTGDGSGDFLYPVLHEAGFASQPKAVSRDDGMKLANLWITAVIHCAPPANKPTPVELNNCAPWLDEEIHLLRNLRVVVCLGKIAFDGIPLRLRLPPRRRIRITQRSNLNRELSSLIAKHQHRQADAPHVSGRLPPRAATGGTKVVEV
jgi:uracil-DNA glycosylase family 4